MLLIPILEQLEQNADFVANPLCSDTLGMSVDFYKKVGYNPPWICYYAALDGELVGSAGFKGKPVHGKIEIAYGTFPEHRHKGIGSLICRQLVSISKSSDPGVVITARTLPEENYSTRILRKNNFEMLGVIIDPEDGEVWEWQYMGDQ